MKKWESPEVAELNISETANGLVHSPWETDNFFHDDAAHNHPSRPGEGEGNTEPGDGLS